MQQITGLTDKPTQTTTVILPDGTQLILSIFYIAQQLGWYFTSINWNNGTFTENGRRIVNHGNMLRQYRNILNFGLACFTVGNREPTQIEDFNTETSNLYLLSASEVQDYETFLGKQKYA